MTRFNSAYRCRKCDEVFWMGSTRALPENSEEARLAVMHEVKTMDHFAPEQRFVHACPDGGWGIAEFVGYMPIDKLEGKPPYDEKAEA